MLADFRHPVEFVLGHVFRGPVASVVGKIQLLVFRVPVETHGIANTTCDHLGAAAVEIHPPDLSVGIVMEHVIAGLSDRDIQLVVRPDGDELPAMCFVFGQVVIDHRRLGRIIQNVVDLLDLGNFRQLGDVKRTVLERDAIWTVKARRDNLNRSLPVLVDDGIDLVDEAAADKHRALVAHRQ